MTDIFIEPLIGTTRTGREVDNGVDQVFISQTHIVGGVPETRKVRIGYAMRKPNAPLSLIGEVSESELKEIRLALAKRDAAIEGVDDPDLPELVRNNQRRTYKPPPMQEEPA